MSEKDIRAYRRRRNAAHYSLYKQRENIQNGSFEYVNDETRKWSDLIKLNQTYGRAYLTQDNKVEALTDGKEMFRQFLKDIGNAKETINIMYFILKTDIIGQQLVEALTERARHGVKIRLLVDALGSRGVNRFFLKDFLAAGGEFARFFPPKIRYLNTNFNYRNHRKLVVIDDRIGYIGGFNIAKEYLGYKKKFGYWRDTFLRIRGGCVQDMNGRFLLDWRSTTKEKTKMSISQKCFEPPEDAGKVVYRSLPAG